MRSLEITSRATLGLPYPALDTIEVHPDPRLGGAIEKLLVRKPLIRTAQTERTYFPVK